MDPFLNITWEYIFLLITLTFNGSFFPPWKYHLAKPTLLRTKSNDLVSVTDLGQIFNLDTFIFILFLEDLLEMRISAASSATEKSIVHCFCVLMFYAPMPFKFFIFWGRLKKKTLILLFFRYKIATYRDSLNYFFLILKPPVVLPLSNRSSLYLKHNNK